LLVLTGNPGEGDPNTRLLPGRTAQDVVAALGDTQERLIVMTRSPDADDAGFALAAARGVPVLVTEPV
jgi:hypothetical protein